MKMKNTNPQLRSNQVSNSIFNKIILILTNFIWINLYDGIISKTTVINPSVLFTPNSSIYLGIAIISSFIIFCSKEPIKQLTDIQAQSKWELIVALIIDIFITMTNYNNVKFGKVGLILFGIFGYLTIFFFVVGIRRIWDLFFNWLSNDDEKVNLITPKRGESHFLLTFSLCLIICNSR